MALGLGAPMKLVTLRVSGIGCASCVAPVKEHFLRIPSVQAVHVLGSRVYLILGDNDNVQRLILDSGAAEYYSIKIEGIEEVSSIQEGLERIRRSDRLVLSLPGS
ncbi:hypothetical protein MA03_03610 [Infirmifilum uzonense]|uniref:Uncharacterized protein n=2 Tax=Thermofilaceae TaxID=114378 RepID=A0A0F7FID1_9CREN|nr:hypothetical protein MA03_03610 [Infirmifilum uzonense]